MYDTEVQAAKKRKLLEHTVRRLFRGKSISG